MTDATPLTIVHALAPAPFGGLESVVRLLALGQRRRGYRVVVAAIVDTPSHPFVQTLTAHGIDVVPVHLPSGGYRAERLRMAALIREVRPDVVHTHGYRPDILDIGVARRHGVATVSTLHGFTGGDWKVRTYERLQLRALRAADAVVAVSHGVYERARQSGVGQRTLHLVRNAYAATDFADRQSARAALGIEDDGFHVAWIGRLSAEKGGDVAIDALAYLRDTPVRLSIIGDGPDRTMLEGRAVALGVGGRVTLHGIVPDAARYLPAFDAFVLSSRTEGTPMVLLEAMAARLPIVATAVGGVPDVVSDTEGVLVPSNDPPALAAALHRVLDAPAATRERAERAHTRLETEFGVDPWLARYEALYRAVRRAATPR